MRLTCNSVTRLRSRPRIRREIAALGTRVPTDRIESLQSLVAAGLAGQRLPVALLTAFGALALLLASVGVYAGMFAAMAVGAPAGSSRCR